MTALLTTLATLATAATSLTFTSDGACGDERSIRDAITVRLGKDPFRDGSAGPAFVASISREGQGFVSQLAVDGGSPRRRSSTDCRELSQSLALAIALVLETLPPPEPPKVEAPPPAPPVVMSLALGTFASGGLSPHVTAGLAGTVGLRVSGFVLDVEARFDVPAAATFGGARISSFPLLFSVSPGLAVGPVRLTAPISAGPLFVAGPANGATVLVLAGVQVSGVIPLAERFSLEPFARGQVSFNRVTVLSGTSTVWTTWPIAGIAGLALRYDFR